MLADRSYFRDYTIALMMVALAVVLRFLIDPVLGDHMPYQICYFAIGVAAAWFGRGPALAVLLIAYLTANYLFAYPRYSIDIIDEENLLATVRYFTIGLLVAYLGTWGRAQSLRGRFHMDAKDRDLQRARQEKERTHQLLASIGDGLITVDLNGRVTFMNQVAEQLCGWNADAAKGRPVEEVFPIVDGHSRTPVDNPALQALADGRVALLPDNVVLLARDGVERAIDDSAAPIRDDKGTMTGSVLIFRDITERLERQRVPADRAFALGGLHLLALEGFSRLTTAEATELEQHCRRWIQREWHLQANAVRMVHLNGYNLIIRQERVESSASGKPVASFTVSYERLTSGLER